MEELVSIPLQVYAHRWRVAAGFGTKKNPSWFEYEIFRLKHCDGVSVEANAEDMSLFWQHLL